jgi:glycosyltransferase involved in cell wall biosynthesis
MENVIFLGMLPSNRLAVLYRSAIALIVPSICYEVFALVLFEAFSNRTPAIVNDLGALPEIVRECRGGLVCKEQEEFLSAMERLQTHEELRKQLGHNAYRMWESEWSEQAHLRRYLNLLSDTAQRKYGSVPWNE